MRKVLGEAPLDIGGWLIVLELRLVLGILPSSEYIYQVYRSGWGAESILFILTFLYGFFALVMMARRHKAFPGIFIGLEAFAALSNIIMLIISLELSVISRIIVWPFAAASFLLSVIAVLYILLSKRVKRTFVWNWDKSVDQRLIDRANGIQAM
jgi:hypothetical protein